MPHASVIGKSYARPDAYDKVTGGRGYPINVKLPGMLHGKLLRSQFPHARITSIDVSQALALPGVKAVLTPDEVPNKPFTPVYIRPAMSKDVVRDLLILDRRVRYAGQPIAAVAATSETMAEQALGLIDVEYEELPAMLSPEASLAEGAPRIHEDKKNNIAKAEVWHYGDLEAGFAEADHVFEGIYETQRVHTCYMEPRVCVVDCDPSGHYTVHSSMQHIFGLREKLAFSLDISESKVTVVKPQYIGGGFGGKLDMGHIEPVAALLSRKTGLPVRIEQTRYEDFITTCRNPIQVYLKTGVKNDGTITAREARSTLDCGAHATHGTEVLMVHGLFGVVFPYKVPNLRWEGRVVYTNNIIGGGFRGYGCPQGCFAVESQADEICDTLGLDPFEFRLKNGYRAGDRHPLILGAKLDSYGFEECLKRGAAQFGWSQRKAPNSDTGARKRGIGFATQSLWVSGCKGFAGMYEHSGALIKFNPDGSVGLGTGSSDVGGGQTVILCQIAAEELGIPLESVRMMAADTDNMPYDAPMHASRGTYSCGIAVKAAAADAKAKLLKLAGFMLKADVDDLEIRDGRVFIRGTGESSASVADVVQMAESSFSQSIVPGYVRISAAHKGGIIGMSSQPPPANPSPASAEFVEVEVDTETGEVHVLRATFAHDLGKVINPNAAEGQVEGGFQQGMGYAVMEHLAFDPETGACLTGNFLDYKMPTSMEMPRVIDSIFIESEEPSGPFGAKSLAEQCATLPAAAISNAIYNAIGVRFRKLPITPENVLRALGKL